MQMDGLILAGGKSIRMGGKHKGNLVYGAETFTEKLIRELKKETQQIWISYGEIVQEQYPGCQIVLDVYPCCGPIGGLHAAMQKSRCGALAVAACDMPFLKAEFFHHMALLLERTEQENGRIYAGIVPAAEGKIHPLAAIYRCFFKERLQEQIEGGNYRMADALKQADILYIDMAGKEEFTKMLRNINTISEYETLF